MWNLKIPAKGTNLYKHEVHFKIQNKEILPQLYKLNCFCLGSVFIMYALTTQPSVYTSTSDTFSHTHTPSVE